MKTWKIIVIWPMLWISCGVIGAGFDNAYFQRKYSTICEGREDLGKSMIELLFGPFSLIVWPYSGFGKYGWSLSAHANSKCDYRYQ